MARPRARDQIIGFAYGQPLKRPGYLPAVGRDRFLRRQRPPTRRGGRELYTAARERGYRQPFAGITQPYEPRNGFQRSFGFQACFAAWHERELARRGLDATRSAGHWRLDGPLGPIR
jgi:L-amino acid N-acyltransferase YncA